MMSIRERDLYWYDDAIYKIGFYNYYQKTVDPSPWSFMVCFSFCFLLIILLPRYISLYRSLWKKKWVKDKPPDIKEKIICGSDEIVFIDHNNQRNSIGNDNDDSAKNMNSNNDNAVYHLSMDEENLILSRKNETKENINDSFATSEKYSSSLSTNSSSNQVSQSLYSQSVDAKPSNWKKNIATVFYLTIRNSRLGRAICRRIVNNQTNKDKNKTNVERIEAISSQSGIEGGVLEHCTSYINMKDDGNNNDNQSSLCQKSKSDERTPSCTGTNMGEKLNISPQEESLVIINAKEFYDDIIDPKGENDTSSSISLFSETSNPFLIIRDDLKEFAKVDSPDDFSSIPGDWEEDFDPTTQTTFYYHPDMGIKTNEKPKESPSSNVHPWYYFYCSSAFRRKLRKIRRWDDEMKELFSLALPYTIHTIVVDVFGLLELGIIGRLLGTTELSAYFITEFAISFATMFFYGILQSLKVLVSQAHGARNWQLAGTYVQLGVWTHHLFSLPLVLFGWNFFDNIVLRLGFDEETAESAENYARFALLLEVLSIYNGALNCLLDVAGFETYCAFSNGVRAFFSFITVFTVSTFSEGTELWMVGAIHMCINILFFFFNIFVIIHNGWLNGYLCYMMSNNPFKEWLPIKTLLKASFRLSSGRVIESCEWNILFVFAAIQGPAEVAIWGLVGKLWDFADDIVIAVCDASKVRIAHLLGSGLPAQAKYSSEKSLFMGVVVSIIMSMSLGMLQSVIPRWLTNDLTLQRLLGEMIPMVCLAVALLSFGSICWSILCAQGRTHLATGVTSLGSLLIALPLAAISNFVLNFNLQGLISSLIIGYSMSGFFNSILMLLSNWTKISKKVRNRTKRIEEKLENTQTSSVTKKHIETTEETEEGPKNVGADTIVIL
mmetsp:Transcript_50687/g.58581  ORF Transcript_50687/g.58581 Transcript_50687/m.58581 type:complete len:892 (-) Transcript_50687:501-3176(-)